MYRKLLLLHSLGIAALRFTGKNTVIPSSHPSLVLFLTADGKQDTEDTLKKHNYILIFA